MRTRHLLAAALLLGVVSAPGVSVGGPAEQPGSDLPSSRINPSALEQQMADDMNELYGIEAEARGDADLASLGCVQEKVQKGEDIMVVSAPDFDVLRDSQASPQSKALAGDKVTEEAKKMADLPPAARRCQDKEGGEAKKAKTNLDAPKTIPVEDPTKGPDPIPPPGDDTRPPLIASPPL